MRSNQQTVARSRGVPGQAQRHTVGASEPGDFSASCRGVAGHTVGYTMGASEHTEASSSGQEKRPSEGQSEGAREGGQEGCSLALGLPEGVLSRVLDSLDGRSLLRAGAVCRRLRAAVWDAPALSSLRRWRRVCEGDLEAAVFALFDQALQDQDRQQQQQQQQQRRRWQQEDEESGREQAVGDSETQIWSGARFWGNVWGAQFVGSAARGGSQRSTLSTQAMAVESASTRSGTAATAAEEDVSLSSGQPSQAQAGEPGGARGTSEGMAEWASTELWLAELEAGPGGAPRVHQGPDGRSALVVECRFCKEQEVVLLPDTTPGCPCLSPHQLPQAQGPLPQPLVHPGVTPRGAPCSVHSSSGVGGPQLPDVGTATDSPACTATVPEAAAATVPEAAAATVPETGAATVPVVPEYSSGRESGACEGGGDEAEADEGEAPAMPPGWRWFLGGASPGYARAHSRWYWRGGALGGDVESGGGGGGGGEGAGERLLTRKEGCTGISVDRGDTGASDSGGGKEGSGTSDAESAVPVGEYCPVGGGGAGQWRPARAQDSSRDGEGAAQGAEGRVREGEGAGRGCGGAGGAGTGVREWEGAEAGLQQWEGAGLMAASGMVRPCQCGGSMACLHLTCLQRWIERRRMDGQLSEAALRCEVCLQPYRVRVEEKLDLSWARLCSNASISFYAEFCTIAATLASMAFLFVVAFAGRHQPQQQDGSGLVALYTSLLVVGSVFILGCFTLARLMSRWRGALCVPLLSPEASALCSP